MKRILLASAALMTLSTGAALAFDDNTTVGLRYVEEETMGVDVTTRQLIVDGDHGDFQYDLSFGVEEQGTIEGERFNADVTWTGLNIGENVTFGPKFTYLSADYDSGIGELDSTWVGAAAKIEEEQYQVTGYAQTELGEATDDWTFGVRTDISISQNFMINGEISHTNFEGLDATAVKLGSRYTVGQYYGEAGVNASDVEGVDGQGYYLGLGLSF